MKIDLMRFDWITIFCGVSLLSLGLETGQSQIEFFVHSRVTLGEVVRLNHGAYHPQISFKTIDNETITFPAGTFAPVEVGDRLQVRYKQDQPLATATIDSTVGMFSFPLVFSIAGFGLIVYGLLGKSLLSLTRRPRND